MPKKNRNELRPRRKNRLEEIVQICGYSVVLKCVVNGENAHPQNIRGIRVRITNAKEVVSMRAIHAGPTGVHANAKTAINVCAHVPRFRS